MCGFAVAVQHNATRARARDTLRTCGAARCGGPRALQKKFHAAKGLGASPLVVQKSMSHQAPEGAGGVGLFITSMVKNSVLFFMYNLIFPEKSRL